MVAELDATPPVVGRSLMPRISAGILLYRRGQVSLEVLIVIARWLTGAGSMVKYHVVLDKAS